MCSDKMIPGPARAFTLVFFVALLFSCSVADKVRSLVGQGVAADISIPKETEDVPESLEVPLEVPLEKTVRSEGGEPVVMNAELDEETGEMVAVDVITESKVVARFNNVCERLGQVSISFDIEVPAALLDSDLQLSFSPVLTLGSESRPLEKINVSGSSYRERQMRGYERYRAFLASIVTDSLDLVMTSQLERFLQRYYPETYAMKRDSSIVPEPSAENLFGVSQQEALRHYSMTLKRRVNDWKKHNRERMYRRYVKDPLITENIRLDTIVSAGNGDWVYRYVQSFRTLPGLKRVTVGMTGSVRRFGEAICELPLPDSLVYYISSLSTLADCRERYKMKVIERVMRDKTFAKIEFAAGKTAVDTSIGANASGLERIRQCMLDVFRDETMVLDSVVVAAGCSPEGSVALNDRLSKQRSAAVRDCLSEMFEYGADSLLRTSLLSENWTALDLLVAEDTLLTGAEKRNYAACALERDADRREAKLRRLGSYSYIRDELYPRLRTVSFDFHLHRRGMYKDTVHTCEIDTAYMRGLDCLKKLDYAAAVEILRPYADYNAALAYACAGYDHSSWAILEKLPDDSANVCYLKSLVLIRLGRKDEAMELYRAAVNFDSSMRFRANLDPEMHLFKS